MKLLFKLLSLLLLTSCFDQLNSENAAPSINSYITSEDFAGADSARNIITGIEISWTAVNPAKNITGYRIYKYKANVPILISTVSPETTSYIDGDIISGSKYQYLVKTVDPSKAEDSNTQRVTAIAWSGLNSVISTSNDTVTVNFDSRLQGVFLQVFLQGEGKNKTLVKTLSTRSEIEVGSYTITQWPAPDNSKLKPGAQYKVMAVIGEIGHNVTDGNLKEFLVTTRSYGYEGIVGGNPGWNNIATLRAFGRSPGTQVTTTLGLGSASDNFVPDKAKVDIGFLPFTLPSGFPTNLYRYIVIRFAEDATLNTSSASLAACPNTFDSVLSLQPCIVKNNIHPTTDLIGGMIVIQDNTVWGVSSTGRPPRYRYTMALKHLDAVDGTTGYVESLPFEEVKKFSALVPIPPDYMVLVNREAVNFEYCTILRSTRADPLNFNRCSNYEIGSRPYNSGPGKSALLLAEGYFDFGYNLFVDRYPLACNNDTESEDTNFNVTGKVFETVSPSSALATDRVLYVLRANSTANQKLSNCLYRQSDTGSWKQIHEFESEFGILSSVAFNRALTNRPNAIFPDRQHPKFSYANWNSQTATMACESFSETGYGTKRIPRMKEYRALMAPPFSKRIGETQTTDLYFTEISTATAINGSWSAGGCVRGDVNSSLLNTSTTNVSSLFSSNNNQWFSYTTNYGPAGFFIGAKGNSDCISKYGVADILETTSMHTLFQVSSINTAWYPTSDYFSWTPGTLGGSTSGILKGLISPLDSGNIDVSYDISGTQSGYIMNVATATQNTSASSKFNLALGIPVLSTQQGTDAYSQNRTTNENYGQPLLSLFPNSANAGYYGQVTSRYSSSFQPGDSYISRVRCVLPAE